MPIIEDKPSESTLDQIQQVEITVDPVLPSEGSPSDDIVSKENENDTIQIIFANIKSDEHGGNLLVPLSQEGSSSVQKIHPAVYLVPPPSNLVVSFDWNLLARPRLPSNVPFRIKVQAYRMIMAGTIIDEGASMSILSSTAWTTLGSPSLLLEIRNMSGFSKGTSRLLEILPNLPVTLRRKTIHLNVMAVQGPLDYNLLLGCDYIYSMRAIVSSLFRVMCFLYEGRMVQLIDQLSFPC